MARFRFACGLTGYSRRFEARCWRGSTCSKVEEADKKIGRTMMARHEAKLAAKSPSKPAAGLPAKEKKRR